MTGWDKIKNNNVPIQAKNHLAVKDWNPTSQHPLLNKLLGRAFHKKNGTTPVKSTLRS